MGKSVENSMFKALRMKDKVSVHKKFPISIEGFEKLTETDFLNVGLVGDPSHQQTDIDIKRRSVGILTSSIEDFHESNITRHLYVYGSWGKGSGITHILKKATNKCQELPLPYLYVDHITPYLYSKTTAERYKDKTLEKLQQLGDVKMVLFADEVRYYEVYDRVLNKDNALVIGSGHMPKTELRDAIERFQIIDIDKSDGLSASDIYYILKTKLQTVMSKGEYPLTNQQLLYIANNSNVPGEATDILDCLLKYYVAHSKRENRKRISNDDVKFWTEVMHTEEYWGFVGPPSKRWSAFKIVYFDGKEIHIEEYQ